MSKGMFLFHPLSKTQINYTYYNVQWWKVENDHILEAWTRENVGFFLLFFCFKIDHND